MITFKNTYSFCNNDTTESSSSEHINKFVLLLRKGVYPYEYVDDWERFNEKLLSSKKIFYSNLNTDYDMLLMVEEGIRGRICHSIHRYAKANNKYMKNYNNNEESSYIQYLDANILYGWAMSKKLPVNGFKWTDNNKINEEFIKNYNKDDKKGYIFEVDVKYPKKLHENYTVIYRSYLKQWK